MHLMRSMPTSPTTTRQEYDVYKLHTPAATPELHSTMTQFYKQVTAEDVELCNLAQKNLQRGIYTSGLCKLCLVISYSLGLLNLELIKCNHYSAPVLRRGRWSVSGHSKAYFGCSYTARGERGAEDSASCEGAAGEMR